ncbi:HAD hydrolase-like protein [Enterocloster sp.]|uniref:HAD hydrolase-like protein n=1 Tax=Enterocloster sp. TaxID=2719315 RepID=UPI0039A0717D
MDICRYLKERYGLYVVTNGTSSTQYKRLAASGLDCFMKDIFVSEDAGSQKPRRNILITAFQDTGPGRAHAAGRGFLHLI